MARRVTCLLWVVSLSLLQASAAGCVAPVSLPPEPTTATAVAPPTTTVVLPNGTVEAGPAILDSLEQAQALVSFSVLEPDPEALPATMETKGAEWQPMDERGIEWVRMAYEGGGQDLVLTQMRVPWELAAPTEPHQVLIVRGQEGYLMTSGSAHAMVWQESQGAIRVVIGVSSGNLSLDELLRIADGLRALTPEP